MDDLISRISKGMPSGHDTPKVDLRSSSGDPRTKTPESDSDTPGLLNSLIGSGQFLQSMSAGVILQDFEGRLLDCNEVAEDLLGSSRAELVARGAGSPGWDCQIGRASCRGRV